MKFFNKVSFIAAALITLSIFISCEEKKASKEEVKTEEVKTEEVKKEDHFTTIDQNNDGKVTADEFLEHGKLEYKEKDTNGNGKIEKEECDKFDIFNTDGDDFLSETEFTIGHKTMFAKIDKDEDGSFNKEDMELFKTTMKKASKIGAKCGGKDKKESKGMKCAPGKCG